MKKQFLAGKAMLLCLLYLTAAQAAPVPSSLYGHWLKTDGSNRFVIGIYQETACYENETWRICSANEVQGRWLLKLEHGDKTAMVTVQRRDSATLLLDNGTQQELKNIRTFKHRYRPEQQAFCQPLFQERSAVLKGLVQRKRKIYEPQKPYVQLSYDDMRTGKTEYFFTDLDSVDGFRFAIPVYMPVICHLSINREQRIDFLVQPGDTVLLAINTFIAPDGANPDYNQVMQHACLMGSNAAFNNQYQHYARYLEHFSFKQAPQSSQASGDAPAGEKKQQQYDLYRKLYDSILHCIDLVYPAYVAERRFIDFVKTEARYNCVLALLEDRENDSVYLQQIYNQYLSQETTPALVHDSYYRLARRYASCLHDSRWGNRYRFYIPYDKWEERVQKDYRSVLPDGFVEQYKTIQKDRAMIEKMTDSDIIQEYFRGNREEAVNFRYLSDKITNEFRNESLDSAAYRFYEKAIPNTCLRFAANLQQLLGARWGEEDNLLPSVYRLAIFRNYSQLPGMPCQQVVSVNTANTLLLGTATMTLKVDTQRIRPIDHEAEWQAALKTYRGKTVIIWAFPHYFDKEYTARSLYQLKKMQERYRGQNVVFLKCLRQRQRADRVWQLHQYVQFFSEQGQLNEVFYFNRTVSIGAMLNEAINDCCGIYDTSGLAHHPPYYAQSWNQRDRESPTLAGELDRVLTGRGNYNEEKADDFLWAGGWRQKEIADRSIGKSWTLYDSTGRCYFYISKEPEKPVYELNYDTVAHLLTFTRDSLCMESELVLHELPPSKNNDGYSYGSPEYAKESLNVSPSRIYRYDRGERVLRVYDNKKKLFRTFRVAYIDTGCLVLELVQ